MGAAWYHTTGGGAAGDWFSGSYFDATHEQMVLFNVTDTDRETALLQPGDDYRCGCRRGYDGR